MKYLKTFESYGERKDLALEIAEDILPRLEEIKKEKQKRLKLSSGPSSARR